MTEPSQTVLSEQRGGVRLLTLNRPDRLNAVTDELQARYAELIAEADADPEVRAVVVTGAGKGFCAGADMGRLEQIGGGWRPPPVEVRRDAPLTLRKPLIGAINGAAAGIGFINTLYCDVRFAVPHAKLTTSFVRRGLIGEYAVTWLLPRIVGPSRALDLLLSGRVIQGEEALRIGLVDRLCDPETLVDEAVAYAQDLAENCSPASMAILKRQIYEDLEGTYEEAFQRAAALMPQAFDRPDMAEGVQAYLDKRPPAFPPLPPRG